MFSIFLLLSSYYFRNFSLLIFDQLQPLSSVEGELVVITDKRYPVADGVRYYHVVTGVIVFLRLVDYKASITLVMFFVEVKNFKSVIIFH